MKSKGTRSHYSKHKDTVPAFHYPPVTATEISPCLNTMLRRYIGSEAQLSALDGGEWQARHSLEEPFEYTLDRRLGGVMTRTSMVTVVVRERSSLPGIRS
jgi:hypothetical protein